MMMTALWATAISVGIYLVVGSINDVYRARRERQRAAALDALSESAFLDHDSAGEVLRNLRGIPPKVIWDLALTLPMHFEDAMSKRIVAIIGSTSVRRRVERLSNSPFWFRRVRAARLAHVLPKDASGIVARLLDDGSTSVQAATIESFGSDQIADHAAKLLELMSDQNQSVRFTAQQALLRGDGRIAEPLRLWLTNADQEFAHYGLEVAAYLDDPRLVHVISTFAEAEDPLLRRLVARATPVGSIPADLGFFRALFDDEDPIVRATVIESTTRIDADWLLPRVARALTDRAWKVRRAAGLALAQSGALGEMFLREALDSEDPFAADMARNFLELIGRMEEIESLRVGADVDSLVAWAHR